MTPLRKKHCKKVLVDSVVLGVVVLILVVFEVLVVGPEEHFVPFVYLGFLLKVMHTPHGYMHTRTLTHSRTVVFTLILLCEAPKYLQFCSDLSSNLI